jgi:hypothetical protein
MSPAGTSVCEPMCLHAADRTTNTARVSMTGVAKHTVLCVASRWESPPPPGTPPPKKKNTEQQHRPQQLLRVTWWHCSSPQTCKTPVGVSSAWCMMVVVALIAVFFIGSCLALHNNKITHISQ